jgi:hypothetical protein
MATIKEAIASMAKNIEAATGKKIAEWAALARASGFAKHGARVKWLKEKHGIGRGHATYLAHESLTEGEGEVTDDALLAAQFAGKKAAVKFLPALQPAGRLEASGSFNAMFTHRVKIGAASEVDAELKRWLKQAYEAA